MDNNKNKKLICVIGAGAAGMTAIKQAIDNNFDVICYEKTQFVGGLWRYHEENVDGIASVMKNTIINSSKEMSTFTDFPIPACVPNFMHHSQMYQYLDAFVDTFNLRPHIKFEHVVVNVSKSDDHDKDGGKWKVTAQNIVSKVSTTTIFDAVMICTGHHVKPMVPRIKNQEHFKGKIIHSQSYRSNEEFKDKNVVVVGAGNSGGDVAVDVSTVAKNTYLSTRRGVWVQKRTSKNGIPTDCDNLKRIWNFIVYLLPYRLINYFFEWDLNANNFDHEMFGLKPDHRALSQHPMTNDFMANRLLTNMIKIRKNVSHINPENGKIIFEKPENSPENYKSEEYEVDAIILCTGYEYSFPFIDGDLINMSANIKNNIDLYKFMFNAHLKFPQNLVFIGLFQTIGAGFPAGEMQIRWFMELMKGTVSLPTKEDMLKDIEERKSYRKLRFIDSVRHEHQIDWINFMDDLSSQFGAKPNLWTIFFTDPVLWYKLVFGPCLPFQYRLNGPNANYDHFRQLIMDHDYRVRAPFKELNQSCGNLFRNLDNCDEKEMMANNNSLDMKIIDGDNEEGINWRKMIADNNQVNQHKIE